MWAPGLLKSSIWNYSSKYLYMSDEYLLYLLLMPFVWYAGYKFGQHMAAFRLAKLFVHNPEAARAMFREMEQAMKAAQAEAQKEQGRRIRVEKHGDCLYLYAEDNDQFLAQGTTLQEALDEIERRFPGDSFRGFIPKEQAEALGIKVK